MDETLVKKSSGQIRNFAENHLKDIIIGGNGSVRHSTLVVDQEGQLRQPWRSMAERQGLNSNDLLATSQKLLKTSLTFADAVALQVEQDTRGASRGL